MTGSRTPPPAIEPAGSRRATGLALRLLVTAAALAWVLTRVDLREAGAALAAAPSWIYVLPTALLVFNSAVHALRVKVLLDAAGRGAPLLAVVAALLRANFVGMVLPSGGAEVAKIGFVARRCGSAEAAVAAILVARILELVPWTLLLLWGLWWGLWGHDRLVAGAAVFFAAAFSAVLLLSLVLARGGRRAPPMPAPLRRLARRAPARLADLARRLAAAFAEVGGDRRRLWLAGLLTVPFSLLNCFIVFLILRAHGVAIGYDDVLAVIPAVDTLISLPVSFSGLGVREGLFVDLFAPWGVTEATAVAVGLTRWSADLGRAAVGGVVFLLTGLGREPDASD